MKQSLLSATVVSAMALLSSSPSFGQAQPQCKAIEFAELQTFDKADLEKALSKNLLIMDHAKAQREIESKYAIKWLEESIVSFKAGDLPSGRNAQKSAFDAKAQEEVQAAIVANCASENERINKFLVKQKDKTAPKKR